MRFQNKVVVITGAARGLGQHYANRFAAEGAAIVACDRHDCAETVAQVKAAGREALGLSVDVTSLADTAALGAAVQKAFGRADVLVNNAGLYAGLTFGPFHTIPEAEWDLTMAVNVKGLWLCAKAIVPLMRTAGSGSIINISSLAGTYGMPNGLQYTTSKAAVIGLTRGLAREVGRYNIRVNSVAPSVVLTQSSREFFGANADKAFESTAASQIIRRNLEPEDVAGTVLHLASDAAKFITGQTHMVDGGSVLL